MTELNNERLAELISDAMDCTKWDAETWRVVNTVTDHDDHMSTEQALALGNLISRQSHSTGAVVPSDEFIDRLVVQLWRYREIDIDKVGLRMAVTDALRLSPVHKDGEPAAWEVRRIGTKSWTATYAPDRYDHATYERRPLYPHPKEAEVTVTEEMVERAGVAIWNTLVGEGVRLTKEDVLNYSDAARAALVAALQMRS